MSWIETLPDYLKQNISTVIQRLPESQQVFEQLYDHLNTNKRQKPNPSKTGKDAGTPETAGVAKPVAAPSFHLKLTAPINASEVIFQLEQISFQSPIRKKLNLTFHLLMEPNAPPEPILSILNPATQVPEISVHQFQELIKLCMIIPILGSLMTSKKKLAMLCIWLNDASDPIICQLNFDLIKTQLIDAGKIPPPEPKQKKEKKKKQEVKAETGAESESGSESESETESESDTDPVHDAIIDFFQRQFQLCGILLVNYVPSSNPLASVNKNVLNLNQDSGISITSNGISDSFVMVEAYKGSKAGSLLFLAPDANRKAYLIFGFKKPVMIFELSQIKHISYVNITRLTFSLLITIQRESEDKEENLEFGMIDQQYYSILDSFIKSQRINDNSFDDELREKVKKGDTIEPEDPLHDEANSNGDKSGLGALMGEDVAASDDEDEDGTYHIGVEEDDSGISASGTDDSDSGSESDVTGVSESEGEEEEGDDDDDEEEEIKKE